MDLSFIISYKIEGTNSSLSASNSSTVTRRIFKIPVINQ